MNSILLSIANGEVDSELDQITEAIKMRKRTLATITVASIKPGDTVRFSNNIRPKYLVGKEATVVKRNRESVIVNCPDDLSYGRFRNSKNVRCPNSLIAGLA